MRRCISRSLAGLGLGLAVLAMPTAAKADLQFTLESVSGNQFVYTLSFQNTTTAAGPAQRLDRFTPLTAANGDQQVAPQGPLVRPFSPAGNNGSFATLYDIPGFVSADLTGAFANQFAFSVQNLGITPGGAGASDDAALSNVTVYYVGATRTADAVFTGLLTITVAQDFTAQNPFGEFAGRTTKNAGPSAGAPNDNIGFVSLPALVPEPSSVVLMGLGGLAMLGIGFRRRSAKA